MAEPTSSAKKWPIRTVRGHITFDYHSFPIKVHLFMNEQFASRYCREWGKERITRISVLDLVHIECPDEPWEGQWHADIVCRYNGSPYLEVKSEDRIQREEVARLMHAQLSPASMVFANDLPAFMRLQELIPLSDNELRTCLSEICKKRLAPFVTALAAAGIRPEESMLPGIAGDQHLAWLQAIYRELDLNTVVTPAMPTIASRPRL